MGFAWHSRLPKRPYLWRFAWFSWPQRPSFVSKYKVFRLKSHGDRIVPMDPNKIDFLRYFTQIIGLKYFLSSEGMVGSGVVKPSSWLKKKNSGITATGTLPETQSHGCHGCFVPRDLLDKRGLPWLWSPGVPARCAKGSQGPLLFLVDGETNRWAHQVLTNRTTCKLPSGELTFCHGKWPSRNSGFSH